MNMYLIIFGIGEYIYIYTRDTAIFRVYTIGISIYTISGYNDIYIYICIM